MSKAIINDITLYYELHGDTHHHSVILIAGFSCDHTFWTGIVNDLCTTHKVLIFDNRGVGQTDSPDTCYSIEKMADDVMMLSEQLGLKKPTIIGQSMGSAIAQTIGKNYKEQINKLILINTFSYLNKASEMALELTGDLQRLQVPMKYRVQSIAPWIYSSHFLSQPNQLTNLVNIAENNLHPQSLIGYGRQLEALKSFDSRSWLAEIESPTLVIAAEEDVIAPISGAREVYKGIGRNTQMIILPGGHASPIEQPIPVAKAILHFIDTHE